MSAKASAIVSADWVEAQLEKGELTVLDVRFAPGQPNYGRESYERGHLPCAVFVDFKKDLTASAQKHGGRSPLPSAEQLAETLGQLGVSRDRAVVVYDDEGDPASARLWWILSYLGHEQAYVLDGGFKAWEREGRPLSTELTEPEPAAFVPEPQEDWLADQEEVKAALDQNRVTLIDSRDLAQYLGEEAPFDPVAGHIPGSKHYFWKDGRDEQGRWKGPEAQKERFAELPLDQELIVYCGSGISACPNVLALKEAGYKNVKLYSGSWSDWISYEGNPIATGEE